MLLLKFSQSPSDGKSAVRSTLLMLFLASLLHPPLHEPALARLNPSGLMLGRRAMSVESTSSVIAGSSMNGGHCSHWCYIECLTLLYWKRRYKPRWVTSSRPVASSPAMLETSLTRGLREELAPELAPELARTSRLIRIPIRGVELAETPGN